MIRIILSLIVFTFFSCEKNDEFFLETIIFPDLSGTLNIYSGSFEGGESVTLEAFPNEFFEFVSWSGSEAGNSPIITFIMNENKLIYAEFRKKDSDGDGYYDAPCDRNKEIFYTDPVSGNSWWTDNWRECDGYWAQNSNNNNQWQFYPSQWKEDKFPTNAAEWSDNDGDGTGDNSDTDDDNDGTIDTQDDFPYDPTEQKNTDKPTITNGYLTDDDNDGLLDTLEATLGTNPEKPDTDDDGLSDYDEVELDTDPLNPDTDGDVLTDSEEVENKTNPLSPDSDQDGLTDGMEILDNLKMLLNNFLF